MKRAPWHSTRPGDGVYHDNDHCIDGIFPGLYRAEGTAGRPLCRECARLDTMAALEAPPPDVLNPPEPEQP